MTSDGPRCVANGMLGEHDCFVLVQRLKQMSSSCWADWAPWAYWAYEDDDHNEGLLLLFYFRNERGSHIDVI